MEFEQEEDDDDDAAAGVDKLSIGIYVIVWIECVCMRSNEVSVID